MWVVGARAVLLWLNYGSRRSWWRDWVMSMRLMMEVILEPWVLPVIRFVIVPMAVPVVSVRLWARRHMSLPVVLVLILRLRLGLLDLLGLALRLGLGLRLAARAL